MKIHFESSRASVAEINAKIVKQLLVDWDFDRLAAMRFTSLPPVNEHPTQT